MFLWNDTPALWHIKMNFHVRTANTESVKFLCKKGQLFYQQTSP